MKSKAFKLNFTAVGAGVAMLALLALAGSRAALAVTPGAILCTGFSQGAGQVPTGQFVSIGSSVLTNFGKDCAQTKTTLTFVYDINCGTQDPCQITTNLTNTIPLTFNCNINTGLTNLGTNKKPAPFQGSVPGFSVGQTQGTSGPSAGCQSVSLLTGIDGSQGAEFITPGPLGPIPGKTCSATGAYTVASCTAQPQ